MPPFFVSLPPMSSELNLVLDLAVILIAAGVFTIISKALRQPLILGYIIAGFLVGPKLGLFPAMSSVESVEQWSEIGMIFMMFALGLEFSFKGLLKVGSSALITAGCKFVGMFVLGMAVGSALKWDHMECIFLGGLLSMASTAIVIKAYDDMGLKQKPYAQMVFGTLVVEDLIAIVLMVLLSTMAVSKQFEGGQMLLKIGELLFFLIICFLVGIYAIPTVLKKARAYLNDEILLIVSIGLCFGMVALAGAFGFSSALGAFLMGSILAETVEGEHIGSLVQVIKNLFGAIFFVSVGMMIDPVTIAHHWAVILLLCIVVIAGHFFFAAAGVILSGKGLDNAVHAGLSLSQLGEFGFIIVSLGVSLGVMRDFIYPVIIAVSVITTFTTPYMIRLADPLTEWLYRKLPEKVLLRIDPPQDEERGTSSAEAAEWKVLLKAYFTRILLYGVVLIAIFMASENILKGWIGSLLPSCGALWRGIICSGITLAVMSPFLYGLAITSGSISNPARRLMRENDRNVWPVMALMLIRVFIAIGFVLAAIMQNIDLGGWVIFLIIVGGLAFAFFAKKSLKGFSDIEGRFLSNLNAKEYEERKNAPVRTTVQDKLAGYDVHIETVEVSPDSRYVGMKLQDTPFRKETGVNIVKIVRGSKGITIPKGSECFYPYDKVLAVGTSEQIAAFTAMMTDEPPVVHDDREFAVEPVVLTEDSQLTGNSLRSADMRAYGCMVISVLRGDDFITNPKADFVFEAGDTVWLAGERSGCEWFRQ